MRQVFQLGDRHVMRRNRNVHAGDMFRIGRHFFSGLFFCRGVQIRNLVTVPGQEILQGCEILAADVSIPVDSEVADLVAATGHAHVAGSGSQFLSDGFCQRLTVSRVGSNGHDENLLYVFACHYSLCRPD